MNDNDPPGGTLALTTEIVSAYVANHAIAPADLPDLITGVLRALNDTGRVEEAAPERPEPAVPVRKSVGQDFIVCLEDGKKVKLLKPYLQKRHNMAPAEYRRRWGLPSDYPMVAPAYAERRSTLARQFGLGRKPAAAVAAARPEPVPQPEPAPAPVSEVVPAKRRTGGSRKAA
jgi:predicted transcriptional regulator